VAKTIQLLKPYPALEQSPVIWYFLLRPMKKLFKLRYGIGE
jgi:hypothetical protein